MVARFYIQFATLPDIDTLLANMAGGNGIGVGFKVSDNTIRPASNVTGPVFGATGVVVTTGVWYRIDVRVDVSANPWLVDVQVDGVATTQHTVATSPGLTSLTLCTTVVGTADMFFDDVLVSNTFADYPLGAGYVNHFVPTADGTHNVAGAADFRRGDTTTDILNSTTNAYLLVDDVPLDDTTPDADDHIRIVAPANNTDYVELVFGPAPGISTPTTGPRSVEVICEVFAAGTGLSDEIIKLNDNGTVDNIYDGTQVAGVTTGTYKRKHYATPPTGGSWVVGGGGNGDFNDLRLRYGYATDANPDKSLMCAMIEAEFAEETFDPATLPPPQIGVPELIGYGVVQT